MSAALIMSSLYLWSSAIGMWMVTGRRAILRGVSSDMCFSTFKVMPFSEISFLSATIPMIVAIQLPNAVATRSVGENVSPFPLLSMGASVESVESDGSCVELQRSSPA